MKQKQKKREKAELESLLLYHGEEILLSGQMQREKLFIQHGTVSCFDHSVAVAYTSLRLAVWWRIKVDRRSLVRGALLHDYFLYDWHEADDSHRLHGFRHAKKALLNAREDFRLNAKEEDIIVKHMFPLNLSLPRYRESVLVILADKWCALTEILAVFSVVHRVKAIKAKLQKAASRILSTA
jgi:uncharacterized protein